MRRVEREVYKKRAIGSSNEIIVLFIYPSPFLVLWSLVCLLALSLAIEEELNNAMDRSENKPHSDPTETQNKASSKMSKR